MTVISEAQHMSESAAKDFYDYLTALVKRAVATYLTREEIAFDIEKLPIDLRFSAQSSFGDYSMPVMGWSKNKLGRPPLQIAEALTAILKDMQPAAIEEITATKPGFVNFRLNRAQVGKTIIERVLEAGPDFGLSESGVGTKVIVEHTNINSNKAAHVGHLRNIALGQALAGALEAAGARVTRQSQVSDYCRSMGEAPSQWSDVGPQSLEATSQCQLWIQLRRVL